ncbi:MAG: DMT family transporter [Burkholderiaceae bacterium]
MPFADLIRLLVLAAIWGASFLFLRIVAPALGTFWTAELRVAIAGAAMLLFLLTTRRGLPVRAHWRDYLVLGLFNSALPFSLYAFAAVTLPAGYLAIVNATSPLWGVLVGAAMLGETPTPRKLAGLAAGVAGVALLVRLGPAPITPQLLVASTAGMGAAVSYAFAGALSKKATRRLSPLSMATGSQLGAAVCLLPFALPSAPPAAPGSTVIGALLGLALVCTSVAYVFYFKLIATVGPTRALTVTFLIPLFALFWAALLLHEPVTVNMLAGCAMVAVATWLVTFESRAARA